MLGPIALFSSNKLTSSCVKYLEDFSYPHIVPLRFKLRTNAKNTEYWSVRFDRDRVRRQRKLRNNINLKEQYHVRFTLRDSFGFAEHQEKATYGLGYKITITRNNDNSLLNKADTTNNGISKKIVFLNGMYHIKCPVGNNK